MPELKCTVQTCVHNKQFLCDLDAIEIGGNSAKHAEETCCDSFQERKRKRLRKQLQRCYRKYSLRQK